MNTSLRGVDLNDRRKLNAMHDRMNLHAERLNYISALAKRGIISHKAQQVLVKGEYWYTRSEFDLANTMFTNARYTTLNDFCESLEVKANAYNPNR